jgi:serine/threonine protein kinase
MGRWKIGLTLAEALSVTSALLTSLMVFANSKPPVVMTCMSPENVVLIGTRRRFRKATFVNDGGFHVEDDSFASPGTVTTHTVALEALFGRASTTQSAMWSLGCMFAWMLTGTPLFAAGHPERHMVDILRTVGAPRCEPNRAHVPLFARGAAVRALRYTQAQYVIQSSIGGRLHTLRSTLTSTQFECVVDFLTGLLDPTPATRMTVAEAQSHSIFSVAL